ncbi:MAG: T9SS type A sorting domain-containing protein [Bacteroidales bacterium]|nr:T9SS type A sorting domain-containing protein [Bacteroidales bacterium]
MNKLITLIVAFLTIHLFTYGQFQINWQQSYGSMASDWGYDIAETDGGYLVTGIAGTGGGEVECFESNGGGWLIKIDDSGNLIWQKCFDYAHALRIVRAIGNPYYYLIGGAALEPYPEAYNLWVAKIDSLGNILWERALGNTIGILSGDQYGEATADGGVIATAQIDSQGGDITNWWGGYDGWIIKLDSAGNTDWDQSIGSSQFEFINGIIQTSDGGYLAGLYGKPNGIGGNVDCIVYPAPGGADAIVFKMDSVGNPEWHQCYGGSGPEAVNKLLEVENGYLIAGIGGSKDGDLVGSGWHGDHDVWLIKIDYTGTILWQKCYGGSNGESPKRIFQTSDGGFMVFANTQSFNGDVVGNPSNSPEEPSIWIFKAYSIGNLIWQQCIGGEVTERVYGVVKHSDYKYAVAGEMRYSPSGDVNCSNFVYGSLQNYWVFGILDTTVNIVENMPKTDEIKIYPNPANSVLNIDFPVNYQVLNTIIEILDINGRILLKSKASSGTTQLDIKQLNPGLYIMKIQNDKTLITRRIIIQ